MLATKNPDQRVGAPGSTTAAVSNRLRAHARNFAAILTERLGRPNHLIGYGPLTLQAAERFGGPKLLPRGAGKALGIMNQILHNAAIRRRFIVPPLSVLVRDGKGGIEPAMAPQILRWMDAANWQPQIRPSIASGKIGSGVLDAITKLVVASDFAALLADMGDDEWVAQIDE